MLNFSGWDMLKLPKNSARIKKVKSYTNIKSWLIKAFKAFDEIYSRQLI